VTPVNNTEGSRCLSEKHIKMWHESRHLYMKTKD